MIICPNAQCDNYRHELDHGTETCPLCGTEVEQSKSKSNTNIAAIAIIAAVASIVVSFAGLAYGYGLPIGITLASIGVVMGFISRSKPAIVVTIVGLLGVLAMLIVYLNGM